jgi:enoyl-CoA hydratase/carnithine racemase
MRLAVITIDHLYARNAIAPNTMEQLEKASMRPKAPHRSNQGAANGPSFKEVITQAERDQNSGRRSPGLADAIDLYRLASAADHVAALNERSVAGPKLRPAADIRLAADDIKIAFNQVPDHSSCGAERLPRCSEEQGAAAGTGAVLAAAEAERMAWWSECCPGVFDEGWRSSESPCESSASEGALSVGSPR